MSEANHRTMRIGGASGALIDSAIAVPQLLREPVLHYPAFDYLGEAAMGLVRRTKAADPRSGFLTDFVDVHIGRHLAELIRERGRALDFDLRVTVVPGSPRGPRRVRRGRPRYARNVAAMERT